MMRNKRTEKSFQKTVRVFILEELIGKGQERSVKAKKRAKNEKQIHCSRVDSVYPRAPFNFYGNPAI